MVRADLAGGRELVVGEARQDRGGFLVRDLGLCRRAGELVVALNEQPLLLLGRDNRVPTDRFGTVPASYNGAPSQELWVIRRRPDTGERTLDLLRWVLSRGTTTSG